jgi:hypothetical protein
MIRGTSSTSIVTNFTNKGGSIEVFTSFTNTSIISHDSSLGTSGTVIWGFNTSSTFVSTRWTSGSVSVVSTGWAVTKWGVDSVSGTSWTVSWVTVLTGKTLDGTRETGWVITGTITSVGSTHGTRFSGSRWTSTVWSTVSSGNTSKTGVTRGTS